MNPFSLNRASVAAGLAAVVMPLLLLAACASAPRTYFYTLRTPAEATGVRSQSRAVPTQSPQLSAASAPAERANDTAGGQIRLSIGPVSVPDYVDRPELVVRSGPNEVRVLEQRQWAAPLAREIDGALQADLARELAGSQITTVGQSAASAALLRVAIDVIRFDSQENREAQLTALWTLRDRAGKVLDVGEFKSNQPVDRDGYEALVAAHAKGVAQLASQIAASVRRQPIAQ